MSQVVKESKHFWGFAASHFSYFFIWAITYGFLTLWLGQQAGLSGAQSGVVFSLMAGMSLLFQPLFGVIYDKLVFKKTLQLLESLSALTSNGPSCQPWPSAQFWLQS